MKKKVGIIKRVFMLLLIFLLSINSFAAIVSDNDGSAFITKAEFDALKSSFQEQIDSYNKSIDSKIDGAIASYLSGIKVSTTEILDIVYNDWEKVTMVKTMPSNVWQLPDLDCSYIWLQGAINNKHWHQSHWLQFRSYYERNADLYQRRLLCEAGIESSTVPVQVVWKGVAKNYREKYNVTRVANCHNLWVTDTNGGYWINGTGKTQAYLCYASNFTTGYYKNWIIDSIYPWTPKVYVINNGKSYCLETSVLQQQYSSSINLDIIGGTTTEYDHILVESNVTNIRLSDVDWIYHMSDNPGKKRYDYQSVLKFTGTLTGVEANKNFDGEPQINVAWNRSVAGVYAGAYGSTSEDNPAPTFGLIPTSYETKNIMQQDSSIDVSVGNQRFTIPKLNLQNGFALLAVRKGEQLKWEPKFVDFKSNTDMTPFKVKVYFATAPFDDGISFPSGSTGSLIKLNNGETYATTDTSTNSCKCEFTMPDDGVIYCKWFPESSTIAATNWEVALDVNSSSTFQRIINVN